MGGPQQDEFVRAFMAKLAEYNRGPYRHSDPYIESDLERAKAEGHAEANGCTLDTRSTAITEEGRDPVGIALEDLMGELHEKHPLGTRVRVTVEIVHRQPGERGGPEDL